jgi:hypothetical protein
VDEATWTALAAVLTALGAAWTWFAFRHRSVASGLRGAGLTLLPAAAWLTGTLQMFTEIGGSVADWATDLVLSPRVWAGVVLAGLAVVLLVVSGIVRDRALAKGTRARTREAERGSPRQELPESTPGEPPLDDDMAEVEAILRRRGIS